MSETKPGDSVFVVWPGRRGYGADGRTAPAIVKSVGRRWVYLDTGDRYDPATGRMDGPGHGYGPGRVYADAATWEREQQLGAVWAEFRNRVSGCYRTPDGIDAAHVAAAAAALGWTLAAGPTPTPTDDA